jgi:hypothetical protein
MNSRLDLYSVVICTQLITSSEHKQGLGLKASFLKLKLISDFPFFVGTVISFSRKLIPRTSTGKRLLFFSPCAETNMFVWFCFLLGHSLLTYFECQEFSDGPVINFGFPIAFMSNRSMVSPHGLATNFSQGWSSGEVATSSF